MYFSINCSTVFENVSHAHIGIAATNLLDAYKICKFFRIPTVNQLMPSQLQFHAICHSFVAVEMPVKLKNSGVEI